MVIIKRAALLLTLLFLASSCVTVQQGTTPVSKDTEYHFFFNQGNHLKELIDAGKFDEADLLYASHKDSFFTPKWEYYSRDLKRAAEGLNRKYAQNLIDAENQVIEMGKQWPAPQEKWKAFRETIVFSTKALTEYNEISLLQTPEFRSEVANRLETSLAQLQKVVINSAKDQLCRFDHFSGISFLKHYPVQLDTKVFINDMFSILQPRILEASTADIIAFAKTYSLFDPASARFTKEQTEFVSNAYLSDPASTCFTKEQCEFVSNAYVAAELREAPDKEPTDLTRILGTIRKAHKLGFLPTQIPGCKTAFAEVTSKTLLQEGQIEFPLRVDIDLPFKAATLTIDDLFTSSQCKEADILIILDVNTASTKRRIQKRDQIPSKFIKGHKSVPNPQYEIARSNLYQAQARLARIGSSYYSPYGGWGAIIAQALVEGALAAAVQNEVKQLSAVLNNTPPFLEEAIYKQYKFSVSKFDVQKILSVNYYVIDRLHDEYFKSTLDISEKKSFDVAYNVHDEDEEKEYILSKYNKEEGITSFEQQAVSITLSSIIEHFLANATNFSSAPPLSVLTDAILSDRNYTLVKYNEKKTLETPEDDDRFDSVVAIMNPSKSSLGAGFFVKPDLVLTNYHVVEGSMFVEMKMHNGMETFGKMVKSDLRLDLALIKVQARGQPA